MYLNVSKKFLNLEIVKNQTWFIYKVYNDGKLVCFLGQPIGNSRYSVFGITKDELLKNIEKFVSHRNSMLQAGDMVEHNR